MFMTYRQLRNQLNDMSIQALNQTVVCRSVDGGYEFITDIEKNYDDPEATPLTINSIVLTTNDN